MKRFGKMLTGVMALGLTAAVPAVAKADHARDDRGDRGRNVRVEQRFDDRRAPVVRERVVERHDVYVDHGRWDRDRWVGRPVYVEPAPVYVAPAPVYANTADCNYGVQICDVPQRVLDVVNVERRGTIESARFVRDCGREYYSFTLCATYGGHLEMRVDCGGRLISVERC